MVVMRLEQGCSGLLELDVTTEGLQLPSHCAHRTQDAATHAAATAPAD